MLSNPHFYNRTIRKVVVAFGTMFNDIELVRFQKDGTSKERFKVPLTYGPKEKYITRIKSDPNLTKSVSTVVPRISFNLNGLSYDSNRKQITTLQNFAKGSTNNSLKTQYVGVPYDFQFSLSIYVRNTEDGTQILEQILPFFTPDFTVTVDFVSGVAEKVDIPVILNSVTSTEDYEGTMETTRLLLWDLDFTAKGYVFPRVNDDGSSKLIRVVNTNFHDMDSSNANSVIVNIMTTPDPINAEVDDEYGFSEVITEYIDGVDVNPNPLPGTGTLLNASVPTSLGSQGTAFDPGSGTSLSGTNVIAGLYRSKYKGYFDDVPTWFHNRTPSHTIVDTTISFGNSTEDDNFSMQWLGYFTPPSTGNYNFWLISDDPSYMWIGTNALVGFTTSNAFINNGGTHAPQWAYNANSVSLTAGLYYPIRLQFGELDGGETMQLFYSLAGSNGTRIFTNRLWHNPVTKGF
jgi:hypothetical protein